MILFFIFIATFFQLFASPDKAVKIYQGEDVVWSFAVINSDELLVTHRGGSFFHYNVNTKKKIALAKPKVKSKQQGGLLDVHLHQVGDVQYVYFTFSEQVKDVVTTSLARGIYKNKNITDLKTIFQAKVKSDTFIHFGSRLVFKDNFIFMTVGERGERDHAQDLSLHNGKILRLNLDGTAAKGNPFENNKKALAEIWSYGHRNPQGIDIDPISKEIYAVEFGPRGGDELNLIKPGKNYGWPVITYGKEYWGPSIGDTNKKGMEQPVVYWTPSISPSGMVFYTGDKYPAWKNNLFLANLASTHIRRLELKDGKVIKQEVLFEKLDERIRHIRNGFDGDLLFSTDSGAIYSL